MQPTRRFLDTTGWRGDLTALHIADSDEDTVDAKSSIAMLMARHLVDRFGTDQVREFVEAVVHDRRPVAEAAPETLGRTWTAVAREAVAYVMEKVDA